MGSTAATATGGGKCCFVGRYVSVTSNLIMGLEAERREFHFVSSVSDFDSIFFQQVVQLLLLLHPHKLVRIDSAMMYAVLRKK